ncbi:MAG TPA: hypothetical protein VFU55_10640 [Terracidiphilus sp.]|nr:hypothetical protein [Terracidiphilus sp.]
MSDQQRTQVYQKALTDAQSELDEMLGEFNALASRKEQLEHVMTMLRPLLDMVQSGPASPAAPAQQEFAPLTVRSFQPLAASQPQSQKPAEPQVQLQDRVQDRIQDQSQFQELAPVESSPAQKELAAFAQVAQPGPEAILQRQEAPAPQTKIAASSDRLEDRINFALNFALLS